MTREQKRLLRTVPVAVLILGGLVAFQCHRMGRLADHTAEVPAVIPVTRPEPQQVQEATDTLHASVSLLSLTSTERQLDHHEGFVRSVEGIGPALRDRKQDDARKKQDEEVLKAVAALGRVRSLLDDIKSETLPEQDRPRLLAAKAKCADLSGRLDRCRRFTNPAARSDE